MNPDSEPQSIEEVLERLKDELLENPWQYAAIFTVSTCVIMAVIYALLLVAS